MPKPYSKPKQQLEELNADIIPTTPMGGTAHTYGWDAQSALLNL
jgi:hypothetical protein